MAARADKEGSVTAVNLAAAARELWTAAVVRAGWAVTEEAAEGRLRASIAAAEQRALPARVVAPAGEAEEVEAALEVAVGVGAAGDGADRSGRV